MAANQTTTYDFDEDAAGLAAFINGMLESDEDVSPVVYVEDERGFSARKATWTVRTLTDGSKVADLVISFTEG